MFFYLAVYEEKNKLFSSIEWISNRGSDLDDYFFLFYMIEQQLTTAYITNFGNLSLSLTGRHILHSKPVVSDISKIYDPIINQLGK